MKRIRLARLCGILLFAAVYWLNKGCSNDVVVKLPPNIEAAPSSKIIVPIQVENELNRFGVTAYKATIEFESDVLHAVGASSANTMTESWGAPVINTNESGKITVTGFGSQSLSGKGTLVTLEFDVIGQPGDSTFLSFSRFIFNIGDPSVGFSHGKCKVIQRLTFQGFLDRIHKAPLNQRPTLVDSFMNATSGFPLIEQETNVHFIYRGNAFSVNVPGDMNDWDITTFPMTRVAGTDFWYRTAVFEPDARIEYKFMIDGNTWISDPLNDKTVGDFSNSKLAMPAYIHPIEIEFMATIQHGTLHDTTFYSANLDNSRTIRIYTPPGYNTSQTYPMILFHDGLAYVDIAKANNILDYLIHEQGIEPVIGVFVPPVNRFEEYVGFQQDQFTAFIVQELLPWVDSRYRTSRDPKKRGVLGASNGGHIALWIAANHPDVFGNAAGQSTMVLSDVYSIFAYGPKLDLKLYIDMGTYDLAGLIPWVHDFIPVLQAKGYNYMFIEPHQGHNWWNWRSHLRTPLEMFFPILASAMGSDT
jgi:enterochelin esterase family protein